MRIGLFVVSQVLLLSIVPAVFAQESSAQNVDLPIIDTHIHLYDTRRGIPWPPKDDQVLYRPVLTEHFDEVAKANSVTATVIVEASVDLRDNQWVLDLVKHNPEKYIGLVGSLEIGKPGFAENLSSLSKDKRFVGIRLRERPGEEAFFSDQVWRDLQKLAEMDQTLDVLMFQFSLEDVAMIAKRIPKLKILINHVAGADINGQPADPKWVAGVKLAAAQPNVYCKVSGLFQQSHRKPSPTNLDFYKPTLDVLFDAFGENRLIYGSNWPVTMRHGSYGDFKQIVLDYFSPKGRETLEKVMYRNALKFYGLPSLSTK